MDTLLEGKELEQKRLMALIGAKDVDNRRMGKQWEELFGKIVELTKALQDIKQ